MIKENKLVKLLMRDLKNYPEELEYKKDYGIYYRRRKNKSKKNVSIPN